MSTTRDLILSTRDDLRELSDQMVDQGADPNSPEVFAVLKAYHALCAHFGYPTDLD